MAIKTVGIIGAEVTAGVPLHFLETDPEIGLQVFHKMPDMNVAIRIGQSGGNQNLSRSCHNVD